MVTARSPQGNSQYAVLTPDGDHFVEQLCLENEDLADIIWLQAQGERPPDIPEGRIYRFAERPLPGRL
eukprot:8995481-Alexandrium_andersonii.AAC.1